MATASRAIPIQPQRHAPTGKLLGVACALGLLAALLAGAALLQSSPAAAQTSPGDARWFQIDTEVLRSPAPNGSNADAFAASYVDLMANAADYGYNGVILRGAEINVLGPLDQGRDAGWVTRVQNITAAASDAGLDVIMSYGSIGRCGRLLGGNNVPDLATAYPVTMKMQAVGNVLQPAVTINASDSLSGRSIIGDGNQRANLTNLERGGQYRVGITLQGSGLSVGTIRMRVVDQSTGQILNSLQWAKPANPTDSRIVMAFNSFASTAVRVEVETTGRTGQTLQLANYTAEAVPTLNGVSRNGKVGNDLALAVQVLANGQVQQTLTLGNGLTYGTLNGSPIARDPNLGSWDGNVASWSARHTPPTLQLDPALLPPFGDELRLVGWHALPYKKVVSCSWNDPQLTQIVGRIGAYAKWLGGTGSLLPFDEINTGGAEPFDGRGNNTSVAMGNSIANNVGAVRQAVGGGSPIYIFSDMIDRNTNARPCYEHVVGSLANPRAVPNGVTVLIWDESGEGEQHFIRDDDTCFPRRSTQIPGFTITGHRAEGLAKIAPLTATQLIAAYYDTDLVSRDFQEWQAAVAQSMVTNVGGVVYTAWEPPGKCPAYPDGTPPYDCASWPCKDNLEVEGCTFEHLGEFAELWWDGGPADPTLNIEVSGRDATLTWTLPSDPLVTGTWIGLDDVGRWYSKDTTTVTYPDLTPGQHAVVVKATRAHGEPPIDIGTEFFSVAGSGGTTPRLDVMVNGTSINVSWQGPFLSGITGTWLGFGGVGSWQRAGLSSTSFHNLAPGQYTIVAFSTFANGDAPLQFGLKSFTVGPGATNIDVSVVGDDATITWPMLTNPIITGTWVGVDAQGHWFPRGTTSFTAPNLASGVHLAQVYATVSGGGAPIRLGVERFWVE